MPAIAEQLDDFPVIKKDLYGNNIALVADANTRYVVLYKQDTVTKLISATLQIQHNSIDAEVLKIDGIGFAISFNKDIVAPYAYKEQKMDFDPALLFSGKSTYNLMEFRRYYQPLFSTQVNQNTIRFDNISVTYIERNSNGGRLSVKFMSDNLGSYPELIIAPGQTIDIAEIYFMPLNGTDELDINMFGYEYFHDTSESIIRVSPWIGNGSYFMQASSAALPLSNYFVISPSSFKVHVQHPLPDVSANNGARIINGYNNETMEWSYDKDGSYTSGAPVVKDIAHSIYVRVKGDSAYSCTDTFYVNYKKYLTSDAAEVAFAAKALDHIAAIPSVKKVGANLISSDGKTHVGDVIEYTITVKNTGVAGSVWANATLTDRISDYVTIDPASIIPTNGSYNAATRILTVNLGDLASGEEKVVKFRVTVSVNAYEKDITNSVTVSGRDGKGGDAENLDETVKEEGGGRIVEPEPRQSVQLGVNPVTEGDRVITGTGVPGAQIVVTLPDNSKLNTTVRPNGTWDVEIPTGKNLNYNDKVSAVQTETGKKPSESQEVTVQAKTGAIANVSKVSSNKTSSDGKTRVGDVIEYTITVKNTGVAGSVWANATLTDRMSDYVTIDTATIIPANGSYNPSTKLLTVNLGDIAVGVVKKVKFQVTVNANAYEKDITNGVTVSGKDGNGSGASDLDKTVDEGDGDKGRIVEPEPAQSAQPRINPVTEGDKVITGSGVPGAQIVVTLPGGDKLTTTVGGNGNWTVSIPAGKEPNYNEKVSAVQTENGKKPSEPQEVTVQAKTGAVANVNKVGSNKTSSDNKTRVGDVIEYTITVKNNGAAATTWANATLTDRISDYVTIDTASIIPANGSYNTATRILTVNLGDIAAGEERVVKFSVSVNSNAYEKDITNSVTVSGKDGKGSNAEDLDETVYEGDGDKSRIVEPGQSTPPVVLNSIAVTTPSTKVVYTQGEALALAGMVVTATYSDNSTKAVTDYTTIPTNGAVLNTVGAQTVTVSYTEGGVTKTTSFTVTVLSPESAHTVTFLWTDGVTVLAVLEVADGAKLDPAAVPKFSPDGTKHILSWLLAGSDTPFDLGISIHLDYRLMPRETGDFNFRAYMESAQTSLKAGDTLLVDVMLVGNINYSQFSAAITYNAGLLEFAGYGNLGGLVAEVKNDGVGKISLRNVPSMNMLSGTPCITPVRIVTLKFTARGNLAAESVATDLAFSSIAVTPTASVTGATTSPGLPLPITLNR